MNAIPPVPPIPPIAPLPTNQRNIDVDHLNLLSIFYFVAGGLSILGTLLLLVDFAVIQTVLSNPSIWEHQKQPPPPPMVFAMFHLFVWFYLVMGLFLMVAAILNILSGIFLRARKHRTFSFVVAGINCLQIPLGTVLGVFTIVVLLRESVRELYETPGTNQGFAAKQR